VLRQHRDVTAMPERPDHAAAVQYMRDQALTDLMDGAVTPSNLAEIPVLLSCLNQLAATAIISWLSATQYGFVLSAVNPGAADLLLGCGETATEHVGGLSRRICQLGGAPKFDPARLQAESHIDYRDFPQREVVGMVTETLMGRRVVIQLCQEYVRWVGDSDPTSRRLIERILEANEAEAERLRCFLRGQGSVGGLERG
jgi:bacterioferritin